MSYPRQNTSEKCKFTMSVETSLNVLLGDKVFLNAHASLFLADINYMHICFLPGCKLYAQVFFTVFKRYARFFNSLNDMHVFSSLDKIFTFFHVEMIIHSRFCMHTVKAPS